MKHSALYGDARQTTYFPGRPRDGSTDLLISRIGDTQGNGRFAADFLTPYSWGLLGLEGEAQITMDGETHLLEEGTACLFRADHKSSFRESVTRPFRYVWFDIRGDSADVLIDRLIDSKRALLLRSRISGVLRRELELLREAFELETYTQVTQIASAWKILDCLCLGLGSSPVNVAHSCRVLIETEFLRGISVETIAQELKVSRRPIAVSELPRGHGAARGDS